MGKMNIIIDDKLEERFRKEVYSRTGLKKGDISKAISEALEIWLIN